ncbi:hypothetical protein BOX15_Mlig012750g3, partial [Macrostomum lignano]
SSRAMNPPNSRNTLLVSGLSRSITVDALMGHFCQWGHVGRVYLAGTADAAFAAELLAAAAGPHAALIVFTDPTSVDAALQSAGPHCLYDRPYRMERYRCPESPASPADSSPESQLASLRDRCNQLHVENQQLASLIPAKDKAARLLLGNVEAWRQKLAWVEKKRVDDLNRLQMSVAERQRSVDQLSAAADSLRQQLEEQRAADLAANARTRWQALLERENAALLAVMHAKSKDPGPMQQLAATLQSARQEMRAQEAENSRLTQLLNQRDAQFRRLTEQLEETNGNLGRLANEGGGQQQQVVQSLTAERDRLRAELLKAVASSGGGGGKTGAEAAAGPDAGGLVSDAENDDNSSKNVGGNKQQAEQAEAAAAVEDNKAGVCGGSGVGDENDTPEQPVAAATGRKPLGPMNSAQAVQQ